MPEGMDLPLSVLDLAQIGHGSNGQTALADSLELARHAERLGYHRYWVAEHHAMPGIASSSPAVLIAALAATTSTIRVGSGGVMLPNHAPLVVAEQFGMLEALHPGRIDLGIGRAPGTDPVTARALRRSTGPLSVEDFPAQLGELEAYFADEGAVRAIPAGGNRPDVWLLGSSGYSAQLAAALGLPFAFAHHINGHDAIQAMRLYRGAFTPSSTLDRPYAIVCTGAVCAEDSERARYLAGPGALAMLQLRRGMPGVLPTPEQAAAHPYSEMERMIVEERLAGQAVGDPGVVHKRLSQLVEDTLADELMLTSFVHGVRDRLRSYELIAAAFGR